MSHKECIKGSLLDRLLECSHKLELKGFKLLGKPEIVKSKAFLDVYAGLYMEDRDFRVEIWIHAVKEKDDTYLYAVIFVASKLKAIDGLIPTIRAEIVRWDGAPLEFSEMINSIIPVIANYFSRLEKIQYYRRLGELEDMVERNFGVKARLAYMKLSNKWFENYEQR